jgi:hypothetical protein
VVATPPEPRLLASGTQNEPPPRRVSGRGRESGQWQAAGIGPSGKPRGRGRLTHVVDAFGRALFPAAMGIGGLVAVRRPCSVVTARYVCGHPWPRPTEGAGAGAGRRQSITLTKAADACSHGEVPGAYWPSALTHVRLAGRADSACKTPPPTIIGAFAAFDRKANGN